MLNKSYFVAGTDTGAGKTVASLALMQAIRAAGREVYGMKPVASGCSRTAKGLISDDALLIQKYSSQPLPYSLVNPIALEQPCAPSIAAILEDRKIVPERIISAYREITGRPGLLIMEGIGGWRTPVFGTIGMEGVIRHLAMPVILVVGLRLGCINHALLTLEAIYNDKIELAGWIANHVDPDYDYVAQTMACLKGTIERPLLGELPYMKEQDLNRAGSYLNIIPIL